MTVEKRLILCYLLENDALFDGAWRALTRLHQIHGESLFLYAYGARLVDCPDEIRECRLLTLVMREQSLREISSDTLARLTDVLHEFGATYIKDLPRAVTAWCADLSEWLDGFGPEPSTPEGLVLAPSVQPSVKTV